VCVHEGVKLDDWEGEGTFVFPSLGAASNTNFKRLLTAPLCWKLLKQEVVANCYFCTVQKTHLKGKNIFKCTK